MLLVSLGEVEAVMIVGAVEVKAAIILSRKLDSEEVLQRFENQSSFSVSLPEVELSY